METDGARWTNYNKSLSSLKNVYTDLHRTLPNENYYLEAKPREASDTQKKLQLD